MEHTPISPENGRGALVTLSGAPFPMPAVSRILARFERVQVEAFIEVAIATLDLFDGDADEENATDVEDDHALSPQAVGEGPGCIRSDSDFGVDDVGEQATWQNTVSQLGLRSGCMSWHDDDAEDDDDDSVVDDRNCDEPYQDLEPELEM